MTLSIRAVLYENPLLSMRWKLSNASLIFRSFAGEALERERFGEYVSSSYNSGLGFADAKANLESINRFAAPHLHNHPAMKRHLRG